MKLFIKEGLIILAIIFIFDWIIGDCFDRIFVYKDVPKISRIESSDEELVILGSSRAEECYVSNVFRDSLNLSVYNYGINSQNIYTSYVVLNQLLTNSKCPPRIVLLELTTTDCCDYPRFNFERLSELYSGYGIDDTLTRIIDTYICKDAFLLKGIKLYKHNTKFAYNLKNWATGSNISENGDNGYMALSSIWNESIKPCEEIYSIDSIKMLYLQRFISLCSLNNIKLILSTSPFFYKDCALTDQANHWIDMVSSIAEENNIPYLDYHRDSIFLSHQDWFYDEKHLNEVGAKNFSSIAARQIKEFIN